jgi:hypothetical protein
LPLANPGERYLTVQVSQPQVEISASGLSAFVRGTLTVEGERPAGSLRLLAGAFDGENRPVGLRLWEIRPQSASPTSEFELTVYSAGGTIDRVEVWAEARP